VVLFLPAAHPRINRARSAKAWAVVGRRDQRSSVSRSSSVRVSGGIGRPVRMRVPPSIGGTRRVRNLFHLLQTQDTRTRVLISSFVNSPIKYIAFLSSATTESPIRLSALERCHRPPLAAYYRNHLLD